jgi:serine/threonine protein kinase
MNYDYPETVPPIWEVGDVILGLYEVRDVFTGGGMGLVYRVYHRNWDMDLAVKSPRPEYFQSQEQIENFEREAETWVNLGLHPHIVSCYYVRRLGGIPRIFAEFVEGGTLSEWIRSRKLYEGNDEEILNRVLDVAIQFAWGLHYAHKKGLVHRDVKPGNVLMTQEGTAKVSDFGLAMARKFSGEATTKATRPGQSFLVPGSGYMTPEYASPEQARGEPLSAQTDIWSWAVSVLEMMKGELDWSHGQAAFHVLQDFYGDRYGQDPVAQILGRCLTKPLLKRSSSLLEEADALRQILETHAGASYPRTFTNEEHISSDALNNKGISFLDLGKREEGMKAFDSALTLNPRNIHAKFNLLVTKWRSALLSDEQVIQDLRSLRGEDNSKDVDFLLRHAFDESGVPLHLDQDVIKVEELTPHKPSILGQHASSIAFCAISDFNDKCSVLSVCHDGQVSIHRTSGEEIDSFNLGRPVHKCVVTPKWDKIIFSDAQPLDWPHFITLVLSGKTNSALGEAYIHVFDIGNRTFIKKRLAHYGWLTCIDLINDDYFATSGKDGEVRVWQLRDLELIGGLQLSEHRARTCYGGVKRMASHKICNKSDIYSAVLLPGTTTLAMATVNEIVITELPRKERKASPFSFKHISTIINNIFHQTDETKEWQTTRAFKPGQSSGLGAFAVSTDGMLIAGGARHIHVWSADGAIIKTLQDTGRRFNKLYFSADSQYLLGSADGSKSKDGIILWDVATGRTLRTIELEDYCFKAFAWNESSRTFCAGGRSGSIWIGTISFPKPHIFLSVAVPTSFSVLSVKSRAYMQGVNAAMLFFDKGDFLNAFDIIRKLQIDEDLMTNSELQHLESKIVSKGKRVQLRVAKLERKLELGQKLNGRFYFNSDRTQMLWTEHYDNVI